MILSVGDRESIRRSAARRNPLHRALAISLLARPLVAGCVALVLSVAGCTSSSPTPKPTSSGQTTSAPTSAVPAPSSTSADQCRTGPSTDRNVAAPTVEGARANAALPLVTGRCDHEVDRHVSGINFTGTVRFGLNGGGVLIPESNWYSIDAMSKVPADVTVIVDPAIHLSPTTQHRFQYLADLISLVPQPAFCSSGMLLARSTGSYTEIGVLRNSSYKTLHLTGLHVMLSETPPEHMIGDRVLFPTQPGLTLPPNSMYFFEVIFPANGSPDSSPKTDSFNFHWFRLLPTHTPHCGTSK